jgi:hypothetical protein
MAIGDELLLNRLTAREAQLHEQCNALDVKASIMLVAITFMAGQTTYLLTKHPSGLWRWEQFFCALILLVAAGILAYMLRIHTYDGECAEDYLKWRDDAVAELGEAEEDEITSQMRAEIVQGCKNRIDKARKINNGKADQVKLVYILTLAAFACNLAVLLAPFFC